MSLPVEIGDVERNGPRHLAVNGYDPPQRMVRRDRLDVGVSESRNVGGRGLDAPHGRPELGTCIALQRLEHKDDARSGVRAGIFASGGVDR